MWTGLADIRVLELGGMVSAPYAGKLLADLGADVIKVETPDGDAARLRGPFPKGAAGDPEQSGLFLYLNTNKRSIVLDPDHPVDRDELEHLMATCHLLVHNLSGPERDRFGLSYERYRALRTDGVLCSITPFGLTGPHSDYRAEEITVAHGGGWGWLSPGALEDPERPPLKAFGHQADFQGGLAGATTALAALFRAQRTGQGEHVDLSTQAYVASILEAGFISYTYAGQVATRHGARGLNPWGIFRCSDGLIFLSVIEQDQWERLVEFMGRPEWAELEVFQDMLGRLLNVDALMPLVQEWIEPWKVDELFHEGQRRRICFAPVLDLAGLGEQAHLRERGFFIDVDHARAGRVTQPGPPYLVRGTERRARRGAPLQGEHSAEVHAEVRLPRTDEPRKAAARAAARDPGLPLEGVRVADFSWVWAGPFCAMQLAHLGADVIKIESAARPDLGRRLPIFVPGTEPGLNRSGYFNQWNQGKRSLHLNLGHPEAAELARKVVTRCDVVVENFATGVMERLGLGYDRLVKDRPDLVYASISGYGSSGPLAEYMGYGPAVGPLCGLSSLSGYRGGDPREVGISLGDPTAGITAAVAICGALVERDRTGRGQHIDTSLWESTAALVGEGWMHHALTGEQPERMGNRDPQMAPHGCFPCAGDDAWVSIACATDEEWRALCTVVDPALARDERFATAATRKANEDVLDERLSTWTAGLDRWEVTRRLQAVGVAAFPSITPEDIANDEHLAARGFLEQLEHPEVGARMHTGIPWRLSVGPNGVRAPAPQLGAHTDRVLRDVLGSSDDEIARLREAGVIG